VRTDNLTQEEDVVRIYNLMLKDKDVGKSFADDIKKGAGIFDGIYEMMQYWEKETDEKIRHEILCELEVLVLDFVY